jgi:hypothetical protein
VNLLIKKIKAGSKLPASYGELGSLFVDMHMHMVADLEQILGHEIALEHIRQGPVLSGVKPFAIVEKEVSGLLFALGKSGETNMSTTDESCQILIEISRSLVTSTLTAKLGGESDSDTPFTLFDLLVMQPLAAHVLKGLQTLDGIADDIVIFGRGLAMDGFPDVKFAKQEKWVRLDFPFPMTKNQPSLKATDTKNEQSKNDEDHSFTIYLVRSLIEKLIHKAGKKTNQSYINLDDPWAQHMHAVTLEAMRTVEVVIEDLTLSVAECTRLKLGQTIALPGASHERLNVKTRTISGNITIASATLGAFKVNKAVQLNEDIDPNFLSGLNTPSFTE